MSPAAREYRECGARASSAPVFETGRRCLRLAEVARVARRSISAARFYSLPGDLIRYEIRSRNAGRLEYRVGYWKLAWDNGAITRLEPVEEILTTPTSRGSGM